MILMTGRPWCTGAERATLMRMRWLGLDGDLKVAQRILDEAIDLARVNPNNIEECVEFIIESERRAPRRPPRKGRTLPIGWTSL